MTDPLKPCPCGKIPEWLDVTAGETYRWRYVGCPCGDWFTEARVDRADRNNPDEIYAECVRAWNAVPRMRQVRMPEELVERIRTAVEYDLQEQFGGNLVKRILEDILAAVKPQT